MNTKKALGALLGLLGSLPAFPFLPLAAGFSAPLLFTANLTTREGEKEKVKIEMFRAPSNRSAATRRKSNTKRA